MGSATPSYLMAGSRPGRQRAVRCNLDPTGLQATVIFAQTCPIGCFSMFPLLAQSLPVQGML
jgi:hypothetical protein